ncbi:MBL fold metallo-hydrolase [Corallococcus sp. H22C18031201]|uniref:ComEC/Rec2 family competence protein n=1 Tax=Citreicoccus inhibens TaxID=2849499 RepID=UPI000E736FBD|nr:MBL fold metallo-hydrolase [Citreicoccus inhibens]MBU8900675.1 MBL fold metallo-hydrolase [Citreicoccus inhibens]RJS25800.1 MBL fold metallo-hydrolase [Corallococcus sp. H22C18031201]
MSPRLPLLLGLLLVAPLACKQPPPASTPPPEASEPTTPSRYFGPPPDGKLHVYFFDVGQGDAALIVSPEGNTVLVDAGPASAAGHLVNRLPELLRRELDLVILTHPHADHRGALDPLLRRVGARRLLEPQLPGAPEDYDALLGRVGARGVQVFSPAPSSSTPNAPLKLPVGAGVELTVLWPRAPAEALLPGDGAVGLESNSIVLRLTYGDTSVLFMGDARAQTEAHLVARGAVSRSTLLKVGAHGISDASTSAFLSAVRPQAAIVSVGASGGPGMPARATLERLGASSARLFRTDIAGEVQAVSDGRQFVVTPQRLPAGVPIDTRYTFSGADLLPPTATPAVAKVADTKPATDTPRQGASTTNVDDLPAARKPPTPEAQQAMPTQGYVASRIRESFHVPSCPAAKKILPRNLIHFATREEAARKFRPARDCNP